MFKNQIYKRNKIEKMIVYRQTDGEDDIKF